MKKRLIIWLSVLMAIIIAAVVLVMVFKRANDASKDPQKDSGKDNVTQPTVGDVIEIAEGNLINMLAVLHCETEEEIQYYMSENGVSLAALDEYYVLDNIAYKNYSIDAFFLMNEKKVEQMSGYFTLQTEISDDISVDDMKNYINEYIDICAEFFSVEIYEQDYNFYAAEGYQLNYDEDETYTMLAQGQAELSLIVQYADSFWMISGTVEEHTLIFDFMKTSDSELYQDIIPDIIIEWNGQGGYEE